MHTMELARVQALGRQTWVRVVLGLGIVAVGVFGVMSRFQQATDTEQVLAVRRPVAVGQVITASDVEPKAISAVDNLPAVGWSEREQVVGKVAGAPLYPGQIVHPKATTTAPALAAGEVAMTLALTEEQAVGGILAPGDVVAVLTTPAAGAAPAPAGALLSGVGVLGVRPRPAAGGADGVLVTLRLRAPDAATLQAAYRSGKIDLALEAR